jgi:16S rRNA G1207 methylase RsmC
MEVMLNTSCDTCTAQWVNYLRLLNIVSTGKENNEKQQKTSITNKKVTLRSASTRFSVTIIGSGTIIFARTLQNNNINT